MPINVENSTSYLDRIMKLSLKTGFGKNEESSKPKSTGRPKRPREQSPSSEKSLSNLDSTLISPRKRIRLEIYPNFEEMFHLKAVRVSLDRGEVKKRLDERRSSLQHGQSLRSSFVRLDKREVQRWFESAVSRRSLPQGSHRGRKDKQRRSSQEYVSKEDASVDVKPELAKLQRSPKLKVKFAFQFKEKNKGTSSRDPPIESSQDSAISTDSSDDDVNILKERIHLDENGNYKEEKREMKRDSDSGADSDSDGDDSGSDDSDDEDNIVKRREKNIADNKRMLAQMMAEFNGSEFFKPASMNARRHSLPATSGAEDKENLSINEKNGGSFSRGRRSACGPSYLNLSNRQSPPRLRERVNGNERPKSSDHIQRRQSRVNDDGDDDFKVYLDDEDREAEGIVHIQRKFISKRAEPHVVIPVEDITPALLNKISYKLTGKQYDPIKGTSCHQCRQKTADTKTCCRSEECHGVRGQFCGGCLKKRYGEDAIEALLDPNWTCPPCRGICNCSICRNKTGKCATGILYDYSRSLGYKSVHHLLAKKLEDDDEDDEK